MPDTVQYTVDGAVATVTLSRPEARNALNTQTKLELLAALRRAAGDPQVRAVVLTGQGRAFCAGQDLREHAASLAAGDSLGNTVREHYNPITETIATMPKPVIAAVNGVAAGAGASFAFACDFRLAATSASVAMAFAQIGLGPDSGASWTLQRLVGTARAVELLMLSKPLDAQQAADLGLFHRVVDDTELADAAATLAAQLAAGPTAAYAAIKEAIAFGASHTFAESLQHEEQMQARLGATKDHQAATQAFLNKQQPTFEGH
ncbi:MAG TPA: enoyl-CoA hydratase-related protein [Streptosporangiaceae bacterium]